MLKELLSRGFLPAELPPLFSSKTFGKLASTTMQPEVFTQKSPVWTQPLRHNLARPGGLRRRLSIPNPVNFFRLSAQFAKYSKQLNSVWANSPYSQTKPNIKFIQSGKRVLARNTSDRASFRIAHRVGARYILVADIAQFYPSIYTHSIPWALHTKKIAKQDMKSKLLLGNILDCEVQGCEFGQTKGISVGPDTSLGIAELLLSVIDSKLADDGAILGGARFIDDMEFGFRRLADAERTLLRLEGMLNEFELQLNTTKTRIVELPDSLESRYVTELRQYRPKDTKAPRSKWIDYFNQAFTQARSNPGDNVLRYAIASLREVVCTSKTWNLAQGLLWQSVTVDPGCLRFVLDVLIFNQQRAQHVIDKEMAIKSLGSLVETSAPAGHASEVLWSIWSAMVLNLELPKECQELIGGIDDALIASAAFLAKDMQLFTKNFESTAWSTWIAEGCFEQEYWLFAYEAMRRNWLPKEIKKAKIARVPAVKFLNEGDVSFLNDKASKNYIPPKRRVQQSIVTGY